MEIKGSVAVVVGGASGLGLATAQDLVEQGARVVIVDVDTAKGVEAVAPLGPEGAFCHADISNTGALQGAMDLAVAKFGALHVLVCSAATSTAMRTLGREGPHDIDVFRRVIAVNLVGTFDAVRLAAEKMAANDPNDEGERGVVVLTASGAAFEGQIGQAAYAASKAGMIGLTLPVARDLGSVGIRVCSISPGAFDTPALASIPESLQASFINETPFPKRAGRPEEFAKLARQIIENPMLNGETIRLDGALRMGRK